MALSSKRRVKVYEIVDGDWLDQGTGYVATQRIEVCWDKPYVNESRSLQHPVSWYVQRTRASCSWSQRLTTLKPI